MGSLGQRLRAIVDYVVFVYGSEWKYLAAVVGILLTVLAFLLPPEIVLLLTAIGTGLTILLFLIDTWDVYFRWRSDAILPFGRRYDPEDFSGAQWQRSGAESDGGGVIVPVGDHHAWVDPEVNAALSDTPVVRAYALPERFSLPPELQAIASRVLHQTARAARRAAAERHETNPDARRPIRFNGRLARLATEPTVETVRSGTVGLQFVTYFDGECSNELWGWADPSATHLSDAGLGDAVGAAETDPEPTRIPELFVVDSQRAILSLSDARVANIIGITIFAITADEQVLLLRQASQNNVEPGYFVASASGSLDWADTGFARPSTRSYRKRTGVGTPRLLHEIILRGMLRELQEESGVLPSEVDLPSARVTGYFRWLERGAKPEFTGLVRLLTTADTILARQVGSSESAYTAQRFAIPLDVLREAASGESREIWTGSAARGALLAGLTDLGITGTPGAGGAPASQTPRVGGSSEAAWLAAAAFVSAHRGYLS